MRLEAAAGGRRRRMSLTSLIDVIFLLLLFFMLSSTFSRFGDVELTTGGGVGPAVAGQPAFVRLRGADLMVNGRAVPLDRLGEDLSALNAAGRADAIVLSVGGQTSAQQMVDVMGAVHAAGDLPLQIVR